MLILVNKNNNSLYHGTVGAPTNLTDTNGFRLSVGDGVLIRNGDTIDYSIVIEENPEYNNYTGKYGKFVDGIRNCWNDEGLTEDMQTDTIANILNGRSNGWEVFRIKSYTELVPNETVRSFRIYDTESK